MKKSFKIILAMIMILTMVVSIVACGGASSNSSTEQSSSSAEQSSSSAEAKATEVPKEIVTLTLQTQPLWVGEGRPGAQAMIDLVNSKSSELGAKIVIDKLPDGDQGDQVRLARFASGQYADIDYWQIVSSIAGKMKIADIYSELSDLGLDSVYGDDLKGPEFSFNGKLYAVPVGDTTAQVVFYNKRVFKEAGVEVPKTYDDFLKVCETIKTKGIIPVYYSAKDAWSLQILPCIALAREAKLSDEGTQLGNDIMTNKKHYADMNLFIDGLTKYKEIFDKGYANNKTYLSDDYAKAEQALIDGTAAMYPMGTWMIPDLVKLSGDTGKINDIGAFGVPFEEGLVITAGAPSVLYVQAKGKNVELSKKVVAFMSGLEGQNAWFKASPGIPFAKGVTSTLTGPTKDIADLITAGLRYNGPIGVTYSYGALERFLQDMLINVKTPLQVAQEMDKQVVKAAKAKDDPNWK